MFCIFRQKKLVWPPNVMNAPDNQCNATLEDFKLDLNHILGHAKMLVMVYD